ncbi:MAG: TonB family protein [Terriglobia bacterium]
MASRRSKSCAPGLALAFAAFLLCTIAAWGLTPACSSTPDGQPFQLNRRTATRLLVSQARPAYPPLARINYIRGNVSLLLTVDCAGKVRQAHVVEGHPFLAIAALQAIKKWIYHPFITPSGPAAFQTTVKVDFSLLALKSKRFPPEPDKFLERWVQPPQPPKEAKVAKGEAVVHMRVLVNDKGRVVDSTPLSGNPAQFEQARRSVMQWKFKPARWGNLSVPWYAELEVPVGAAPQPSQAGQ